MKVLNYQQSMNGIGYRYWVKEQHRVMIDIPIEIGARMRDKQMLKIT